LKCRYMARGKSNTNSKSNGATLGFEATLWAAADKLRNNMDAAEYKHVVLGLIFLKYISDAFEERHAQLLKEVDQGADPEDRDEYRADNIFWVPKEARWPFLQSNAKQATIGKFVDDAMVAIERDNRSPKGVLPKDYARPALDKQQLGELIDLIACTFQVFRPDRYLYKLNFVLAYSIYASNPLMSIFHNLITRYLPHHLALYAKSKTWKLQ
jgi:type I restriction-modification system DNA methylase subunit